MDNYEQITDNLFNEHKDIDYRQKYYKLIRDLTMMKHSMCQRCPLVKNCCGACSLLNVKIKDLKREFKDEHKR